MAQSREKVGTNNLPFLYHCVLQTDPETLDTPKTSKLVRKDKATGPTKEGTLLWTHKHFVSAANISLLPAMQTNLRNLSTEVLPCLRGQSEICLLDTGKLATMKTFGNLN